MNGFKRLFMHLLENTFQRFIILLHFSGPVCLPGKHRDKGRAWPRFSHPAQSSSFNYTSERSMNYLEMKHQLILQIISFDKLSELGTPK